MKQRKKQRNEKVEELKSVLETLFNPEVIRQNVGFGRRNPFLKNGQFKTEYAVEFDVEIERTQFYLPIDQNAEWEKDIRTIVEEIKYETNASIDAEALIQEQIQAFAYAEFFERDDEWLERMGEKAVEKYFGSKVYVVSSEIEEAETRERRKINDL